MTNPENKQLSRKDFLRIMSVGLGTVAGLLAGCTPENLTETPSNPTVPPVNKTETPVPTEGVLPMAKIVDFSPKKVGAEAGKFEAGNVSWYDEKGNVESAEGKKSEYVLVGGVNIQDESGKDLPNGEIAVLTGKGGKLNLANKLGDGSWVVLRYSEVKRDCDGCDKHIFKAFSYKYKLPSGEAVDYPVLSVELDENGKDIGKAYYLEVSTGSFYKLDSQIAPGKGVDGLTEKVASGLYHILAGQKVMKDSGISDWNFKWNDEDGRLQIVSEDKVIYDHWDDGKHVWSELPDIDLEAWKKMTPDQRKALVPTTQEGGWINPILIGETPIAAYANKDGQLMGGYNVLTKEGLSKEAVEDALLIEEKITKDNARRSENIHTKDDDYMQRQYRGVVTDRQWQFEEVNDNGKIYILKYKNTVTLDINDSTKIHIKAVADVLDENQNGIFPASHYSYQLKDIEFGSAYDFLYVQKILSNSPAWKNSIVGIVYRTIGHGGEPFIKMVQEHDSGKDVQYDFPEDLGVFLDDIK